MNSSVFLQVVRLSLTAGWMILVLLALRPLLKKAPRRFSCLLWGLVAIRLALPFSFESRVSMVPQAAAAPQKIAQALNPGQVMWVNPAALAANPLPAAQAAAPAFSPASLIPLVWGLGIAAMLLYAAISYFRLYRQVRISAPAGKRVYRCDTISSPFILGVLHPKIYLPSDLEQQSTPSVLAHEQAHLRRGDHLWKPLGYVLLSIYWFNPLCWVAYFLFCRDVEQACDEAVIEHMDTQQKKDYSAALLACAAPNRIQVCPLAFAEVGVKQRIAGVLNYRKPKFWVVALAALLCVSLTAGLLTDPVKAEGKTGSQVLHHSPSDAATCVAKVNLNVRQKPSLQSKAVTYIAHGEQVTVLRTELFENVSWSYVQYGSEERTGWVVSEYLTMDDTITQDAPFSLTAALEYFQRYIQALAQDTPDKAEGFLYFATEYSREFFRDNYAPVTGWDITAISQLADDLCCIAWSSPSSTDYAFVGQMDGRLYVFRTVHELPEHWKDGLDVAQYEQENAMYLTETLLECYAVTKRLMDFAQPVQVKITQKDGWKPAETPWELDFTDAVCGTDTWHFTQEISDKTPQCTILLTAEDGSTARIWDVDGTVLITHPDGTQEICIADFQGEATYEGSRLLSTVYQWATNLA